jgi:hypothetical protein
MNWLPEGWKRFATRAGVRAATLVYVGMEAHKKIMERYKETHYFNDLYLNQPILSILRLGPEFDTDLNIKLRPDIADLTTKEVYEIKSLWLRAFGVVVEDARDQLGKYIPILNDPVNGAAQPANRTNVWHAGTSWGIDQIVTLDTVLPNRGFDQLFVPYYVERLASCRPLVAQSGGFFSSGTILMQHPTPCPLDKLGINTDQIRPGDGYVDARLP